MTFIVIEGPDGSGTSTQAKLVAEELGAVLTSEPWDEEPLGQEVRRIIKDDETHHGTVALAFAADRMDHIERVINPAIEDGKVVVSDRYHLSSLVYQPLIGCDRSWVKTINKHIRRPDLTIVLDVDADVAEQRGGRDDDRFEDTEFQQEVVEEYRHLARQRDHRVRVDANQSIEDVRDDILEVIEERGMIV